MNRHIKFSFSLTRTILLASFIAQLCLFCLAYPSKSQAQSTLTKRYEIDAKRAGISYTAKDALPRGREFKRIDSTYYVGWMLEGCYKYEHAADYLGFKTAAVQLEKALQLLEKDFKTELKTRTSDVMTFLKNIKYHRDWDFTSYALMQCYSNMEEPDQVWKLLQRCKKINLQDEQYMDTYNYMGWTVHRNRYYTNKKYSFLKNSIDENEKYANKLLDSAALKIKQDASLFKSFLSINYENEKMPAVWHYKSILYTYQLNMESGAYYYDKLKKTNYFPANNYATFCAIQAKFREAEDFYEQSKNDNTGDKRLNESYYYLSIIQQYKNDNKQGIAAIQSLLKANGSTPGFGWYQIALARNFIYDGQNDIAKRTISRAQNFKEIHIGTTLGQPHYDFSVSLMNLIIKMREIQAVKFLHPNWWYSPNDIVKIAQLTIEKYGLQFLIINQFAENPERDRVIYKIFSTESTVSFDEIGYLIDGFSINYFLERFKKEIDQEKRYNVKRYYKYFVAKLLLKKGKNLEARQYLESILNELLIDQDYEKLFLARVYEALLSCDEKIKDKHLDKQSIYTSIFQLYPQLIPYSSIRMPMTINTNINSKEAQLIVSNLKSCNIDFIPQQKKGIPHVELNFSLKDQMKVIEYAVYLDGKIIVPKSLFSYTNANNVVKELAFYIFNIGNDDKHLNTTETAEKK